MNIMIVVALFLVLLVTLTPSVTSNPSGNPVARSEDTRETENVAGQPQTLTEGETQMKEELKKELREEILSSLGTPTNSEEESTPHHHHHHHHHYYRHRDALSTEAAASGSILAQELLTMKALLQTTENTLRITEMRLQEMEDRHQNDKSDLEAQETQSRSCEDKMMAKNDRLQSTDSNVEELPGRTVHQHSASDASGSTFIHWGRSTCPNNTEIVYPGVAGGIHYTLTGGPANRLCMTLEPEFDDVAVPTGRANLYGVEYQFPGHLNHDVPCSVCRAQQAVTVMVPGTLTCPAGWTAQYTGHLVAGHYDHKAASEYVCVDGQPEDRPSGEGNQKGAYFYLVRTVCGSLPCPPYVDMKVATCVVCSK